MQIAASSTEDSEGDGDDGMMGKEDDSLMGKSQIQKSLSSSLFQFPPFPKYRPQQQQSSDQKKTRKSTKTFGENIEALVVRAQIQCVPK